MASASCVSKSPLVMREASASASAAASGYCVYPAPLARYEDILNNPQLFMSTLEKLHASMGTKFMIPIMAGKDLDLHRLFVEVTSRGGLDKVIKERRWKEVTATFNFPSTATNASFVLRKYYTSLLFHYEQLYYFKAAGWSPNASAGLQSTVFQQPSVNAAELPQASSAGSPVIGIIDGKFDSGYLVTVTVGSELLKGVLYQAPQNPNLPASHHSDSGLVNNNNAASAPTGVHRRRRRKKSEIRRRDPAHPKPNRSGYNFFFAEQHARLKPHKQGKDREISRTIGERWNKLNESERAVYQEKAMKDKERYRAEMEDYREKLKMGQIISAVPLQQRLPVPSADMLDAELKLDEADGNSLQTPEESSSGESEDEDDEKATEQGFDIDASPVAGVNAESSFFDLDKSSQGGL